MAYRNVSEEDSVSASSDSEDDTYTSWKRKKANKSEERPMDSEFVNPLLEQKKADASGASGSVPGYQRFRKNNIWGGVLQEQSLMNVISRVDVENPDSEKVERDVESYTYRRQLIADSYDQNPYADSDGMKSAGEDDDYFKPSIKERLGEKQESDSGEDSSAKIKVKLRLGQKPKENSCDSGDDDIADNQKGSVKDSLGGHPNDNSDDDIADQPSKVNNNQRETDMDCEDVSHRKKRGKRKRTLRDRLGPHGYRKDPLSYAFEPPKMYSSAVRIDFTAEDSKEKIVNGLAENLQEPKIDLLSRIVDGLGKQKAVDLFHETEMVEESGGLLINNNTRRRTPGGVFLCLLRSDKGITDEVKKSIFAEDRKIQEKFKKERLERRRHMESMMPQYSQKMAPKKVPPGRSKSLDSSSENKERPKATSHSASSSPTVRTHDNSPEHVNMETVAEDEPASSDIQKDEPAPSDIQKDEPAPSDIQKDELAPSDIQKGVLAPSDVQKDEFEEGELEDGEIADD